MLLLLYKQIQKLAATTTRDDFSIFSTITLCIEYVVNFIFKTGITSKLFLFSNPALARTIGALHGCYNNFLFRIFFRLLNKKLILLSDAPLEFHLEALMHQFRPNKRFSNSSSVFTEAWEPVITYQCQHHEQYDMLFSKINPARPSISSNPSAKNTTTFAIRWPLLFFEQAHYSTVITHLLRQR